MGGAHCSQSGMGAPGYSCACMWRQFCAAAHQSPLPPSMVKRSGARPPAPGIRLSGARCSWAYSSSVRAFSSLPAQRGRPEEVAGAVPQASCTRSPFRSAKNLARSAPELKSIVVLLPPGMPGAELEVSPAAFGRGAGAALVAQLRLQAEAAGSGPKPAGRCLQLQGRQHPAALA